MGLLALGKTEQFYSKIDPVHQGACVGWQQAQVNGVAGGCGLPSLIDASLVEGRDCRELKICPPDTSAPVPDVQMERSSRLIVLMSALSCLTFSYTKGDLDFTYVTSRIIGKCLVFISCSSVPFPPGSRSFEPVLSVCDLS